MNESVKTGKRNLLRVLSAVALLLVVALVSSLDGVDYRPYFREPYYVETVARLRDRSAANTVQRGALAAGFGRARLTPTLNAGSDDPSQGRFRALPLAGFGNRKGRPATGVHDDLYVKAVAIQMGTRRGIIVGVDALIIPPEVTAIVAARLKSELGLERDQIYLSATHTHCSLGGWGEGMVAESFSGGFQAGVRVWLADGIVTAIRSAIADLKPASFGHGGFAAPEWVKNRLVGGQGRVDPEFSFVLLKQTDGRLGVIGSFAAHATVLSGSTMEFSADYPGCWAQAVEEATGGTAVFLAGAVGSHGPVTGEKGFNGADKMGRALAHKLVEQIPQVALTGTVAFGWLGLDVGLPSLHVRVTDGIRLRPWLAAKLLPVSTHSYLQVFRLNDSLWISTPCDFSGELGLGIKQLLLGRGFRTAITSFNGDYIGYVIPSRYYHLDGYEPRTMSFFGPNVPDYFEELMRTMALEMAGK
ncbi:MAG: hypothetical protein EXS37_13015 [Opitutus sp.]|nr:hypothetical protein [Opitutus sp.]